MKTRTPRGNAGSERGPSASSSPSGSVNSGGEHDGGGSHVDVHQPGLTEQARKAAADVHVHAVLAPEFGHGADDTVPRWMWWLADARYPVDVLDGDGAARPYQRRHLRHDRCRVRHVDQQQTGVHEVESSPGKLGCGGITPYQVDVAESSLGDGLARHVEHPRVGVDPHRPAPRSDPLRQEVQDPQRSAGEIQRPASVWNAAAVEQLGCVVPEQRPLEEETLPLVLGHVQ